MLDKVVVDKQVVVGMGAVLGTGDESVKNEQMPDRLFAGITVVGKNATIPDRAKIGRNVLINSDRDADDFPEDGVVADGKTI
jgi:glucose-1-phosphate adenylyltransferase